MIDLCSATSMESSRRDLLNDMAEHHSILKNNQNTYPLIIFTPKTGTLKQMFDYYCLVYLNLLSLHSSWRRKVEHKRWKYSTSREKLKGRLVFDRLFSGLRREALSLSSIPFLFVDMQTPSWVAGRAKVGEQHAFALPSPRQVMSHEAKASTRPAGACPPISCLSQTDLANRFISLLQVQWGKKVITSTSYRTRGHDFCESRA